MSDTQEPIDPREDDSQVRRDHIQDLGGPPASPQHPAKTTAQGLQFQSAAPTPFNPNNWVPDGGVKPREAVEKKPSPGDIVAEGPDQPRGDIGRD